MSGHRSLAAWAAVVAGLWGSVAGAEPWYTTRGQDIVDRRTGERVILRGFGLGNWLLPEGYMWGLRNIDRPRAFEAAVEDLIGPEDAAEFWRLFRENYVTEADIAAMKAWGVNSVRIPLLAAVLQPREGQPDGPPYVYDDEGFAYLDRLVDWCEKHEMGVIWDMHGAPGGQNAENISDSDGQARLWTQKEIYWPRCIDLWMKIVERYNDRDCVIGYDLLNEPLLRRYEGIDAGLLREFYVQLTRAIRTADADRLIFVEGDDWAQEFGALEPIDWDPHLVMAFHSYPPTATAEGLERWDRLRDKYDVPLWHGETGEQGPPYTVNRLSTRFLEEANVGWSWWTHKKFNRASQPWLCVKTPGFQEVLDYWAGRGPRPSREDARRWLFEQARLTNSADCVLVPEMVESLVGLDPTRQAPSAAVAEPKIIEAPEGVVVGEGGSAQFVVLASGGRLAYTWLRDGEPIPGATGYRLRLSHLSRSDNGSTFAVRVANEAGEAVTRPVTLRVHPFDGPRAPRGTPTADGSLDSTWDDAPVLRLGHVVLERGAEDVDPPPTCRVLWDGEALYLLVDVTDRVRFNGAKTGYENDSVEVYLDPHNTKSDAYTDGDFRFRSVWGTGRLDTLFGSPGPGVRVAQQDTDTGYRMAFTLPWSALGDRPEVDQYLGIDVHVNDNDGSTRVFKHAWHATRDDAHLSPARLGTLWLVDKP